MAIASEEDSKPISHSFVDHLYKFEFDDLPDLESGGSVESHAAATKIGASSRVQNRVALDAQDADRQPGTDAILPSAIWRNRNLDSADNSF